MHNIHNIFIRQVKAAADDVDNVDVINCMWSTTIKV